MILIGLVTILSLTACVSPASQQSSSEKTTVTVSILPEKYFVERIGGNLFDVNVMVGPGNPPTPTNQKHPR